jgi:hypothetical protein
MSCLDVLISLIAGICCIEFSLAHVLQALVAPVLEYIFEPLSRTGAFVGVNCNIEITKFLVHQPEVVSVHMTGGQETHDAIVWGAKVLSVAHRVSLARCESRADDTIVPFNFFELRRCGGRENFFFKCSMHPLNPNKVYE